MKHGCVIVMVLVFLATPAAGQDRPRDAGRESAPPRCARTRPRRRSTSSTVTGDLDRASACPRAWEGAPPVIPHSLRGLTPITATNNACVRCHGRAGATTGPPPAPASHFIDMREARRRGAPAGCRIALELHSLSRAAEQRTALAAALVRRRSLAAVVASLSALSASSAASAPSAAAFLRHPRSCYTVSVRWKTASAVDYVPRRSRVSSVSPLPAERAPLAQPNPSPIHSGSTTRQQSRASGAEARTVHNGSETLRWKHAVRHRRTGTDRSSSRARAPSTR